MKIERFEDLEIWQAYRSQRSEVGGQTCPPIIFAKASMIKKLFFSVGGGRRSEVRDQRSEVGISIMN